jgi:hypothetical protein
MAPVTQHKVAHVDRGLFLIRYAAAEDKQRPPRVRVSVDPQSRNDVDLVLHPDQVDSILGGPGTGLVVRATNAGALIVEMSPAEPNGSSAATVEIEPLTQGALITPLSSSAAHTTAAGCDVRVLGHVAGIGDVLASADTWLAGPTAPSRIEGIAVQWTNKPHDVSLRYSAKSTKMVGSGPMVDSGSFVGTRGRALPLTSIVLELSGARELHYQLVAEALFLAAPRLRAEGQRIVLSGPTGREPLVGFRLRIEELKAPARSATATVRHGKSHGRVKVFRRRVGPDKALSL